MKFSDLAERFRQVFRSLASREARKADYIRAFRGRFACRTHTGSLFDAAFHSEISPAELKKANGQLVAFGPELTPQDITQRVASFSQSHDFLLIKLTRQCAHTGSRHVTAAMADYRYGHIRFQDSCGKDLPADISREIEKDLGYKILNYNKRQQEENWSCPVYTTLNLRALARGEEPSDITDHDILSARKRHAPAILKHAAECADKHANSSTVHPYMREKWINLRDLVTGRDCQPGNVKEEMTRIPEMQQGIPFLIRLAKDIPLTLEDINAGFHHDQLRQGVYGVYDAKGKPFEPQIERYDPVMSAMISSSMGLG